MGTEIVTITFPTPQRYVVDLWIGIVTWCQLRNIPITTGCIECFFNEDSVFNTPYESVPIVDLAASQRYVIKIKE
jgi:hypothetical protein